ncbi:MAG: DUF5057 domain-containing protein, partial [Lachnospiraceae bacterium]|nr:DUF5057 domain-containing protein [Lachnospiraceae bacterium]
NSANLGLIRDADLIVLNETCEQKISDLWYEKNGSDYIFLKEVDPNNANNYITATGISVPKQKSELKSHFSDTDNDLSWDATVAILSRIAGVEYKNGNLEEVATCPVLYDYNIYENSLAASGVKTSFTTKTQDKQEITVNESDADSSNVNAYKLYLMTQLASPVTMYNAFLTGRLDKSIVNGKLTPKAGNAYFTFTWTGTDASDYWSKYTLIPYNIIDKEDWTDPAARSTKLTLLGYNTDIGMADNKSLIKNRMFIYNNEKNLIKDYLTLTFKQGQEGFNDIKASIGEPRKETDTGEKAYQTADVFYYMLNSKTLYENLVRDISILEIQPYSYKHYDEYWFWYINRYAPNVTGRITATSMSSLEFQANIDDLNAKYDVIYFGTSNKTIDLEGNPMPDITYKFVDDENLIYYHTGKVCNPEWEDKSGTSHKSYFRVGTFNSVDSEGNVTANDDITTKFVCPGNDITFAKFKDISEFLTAGYPIIFADDFFKSGAVDTDKIDRASWIYKLANDVIKKTNATKNTKDNKYYFNYSWYVESGPDATFTGTETNPLQRDFSDSLKHKTFALDIKSKPAEYYDKTVHPTWTDSPYINGDDGSDSGKILRYTLKINSVEGTDKSTKFRLKMFIDTNADGIYDPDTERLDSVNVRNTDSNKYKDRGEAARFDLTMGETYEVYREIEEYYGMIPWKIQVTSLDSSGKETNIRDEVTGLSAISVAADKKQKLYVLQITTDEREDICVIMDGAGNQTEYVTDSGAGKGKDGKGGKGGGGKGGKGELGNGKIAMDIKSTIYLPTDEEIKDAYSANGHVITEAENGNIEESAYFGTQSSLYLREPKLVTPATGDPYFNVKNGGDPYFTSTEYGYHFDSAECYWTDTSTDHKQYQAALAKNGGNPYSLVQYRYQNASKFHYYTHDLKDFELHFFRVTLSQLKQIAANKSTIIGKSYVFKNGSFQEDKVHNTGTNEVRWKDIDMVILGFGPWYNDIQDSASLQLIEDFIDSGKTALFTVSTTSYIRYSNKSDFDNYIQQYYKDHTFSIKDERGRTLYEDVYYVDYWAGYNLTARFADIIGQDRYGAHTNYGKQSKI